MITSIALEILYVDILDTGSYNETGTVNTWGLSGIWFSLAAIQINLLSQCKIGSFSSINYKRSSKSSNFRIRDAPNPGFIVGQLHKKLGNPAAKTSKRLDSLFLYPGFMFHVSIAVMKSSENIKKTWSIILFSGIHVSNLYCCHQKMLDDSGENHQKDLIHHSFFREFMFQTSIAVIKKMLDDSGENMKKIWSIVALSDGG